MNAVIYARYSSHGQNEQSIEGQLRDNYAFAEREGLTIVGEYIDRALTGRADDRPAFQRMIKDAEKRQFERIIVWKLDRFARNRYDSAMYKARLKKYGVKVISATEFISDTPEGIMLEGMLESLAEYYSANLAQNVRRGMRESAIKGTYVGGPVPIGFKVENKRLVADEVAAPAVRFAFEQYAAGVPKKDIVADLNAKGIRNSVGRPITMSSLQKVFRNEKYIGVYRYAGEEVTGGCDAIVDEAVFRRVQEIIDATRVAPAAAKAKVEYLLAGKAFCGMCGARMIGENGRGKQGDVYYYYKCGTRKRDHTCKKKNEKKGFLEWYVVEQTVDYVLRPERMEYIADRLVEEYEKEIDTDRIKALERLIDRYDREANQFVDSLLTTTSAAMIKRIEEKVEALDAQRADAEVELTQLKLMSRIRYTREQIMAWLKLFCQGDPLDPAFQEKIIDVFINAVYIFDDKFVIYYNIKDSKQVSYVEMLSSSEEPGAEDAPTDSSGVRISNAMAHHSISNPNPPTIIFVNGLFGCVFWR